MLYNLLNFNIFYIFLSFIFSFMVCFVILKQLIKQFQKLELYQPIRNDEKFGGVSVDHRHKAKTPTMGGIALFSAIFFNTLFFANIKEYYIISFLIILISFAFIGFIDDYEKIVHKNNKGFQGAKKLILQLLFSIIAILVLVYNNIDYMNAPVFLPLINVEIPLANLTLVFFILIIAGSGNATNITDGLDGLLSFPVIMISTTLLIIIYLIMNNFHITKINLDKELLQNLIIILTSIISSFLCFLVFFNRKPAKIFMGDVGSLFIGAILCYISILLKVEFYYALMALLFIIEITTTILQVSFFKITKGRRLFKMAPFHHHLEKSDWSEKKIVRYFWFFNVICCVICLFLLV